MEGHSGRGEGALGDSRRALASQAGASATGAEAMRCGLDLCSQSLAIMGGGGAAAGDRSSSEGRAADSEVCAAAAPGAILSLRLRGGGDEGSEEEAMSQQPQGDEAVLSAGATNTRIGRLAFAGAHLGLHGVLTSSAVR
eukprot:scaffold23286_cov28-Phaeocystis_antarctica.AAC.1